METITSRSPADTVEAGRHLAEKLKPGDVVALTGELGMGKTQFIRGIAEGLGITDTVSSPTFALVHEYRGRVPLYHFDMYRVNAWDDLYSTGFFDYLEAGGICAVEWSENIWEALPEDAVVVQISRGDDENTRRITIRKGRDDENSGG